MTKRLLYLMLLAFALTPLLRASPPIGAEVQSADYDAARGVTTVCIVNTSHKEISALDLSFQVTFPDGTVSRSGGSFVGLDFVEGIIQGKGGLAPGATYNQEFVGQPGPVQARVDMVAYSDGTADVINVEVFKYLVANRKARILGWQKVNELINKALADHAEKHPSATVAGQIKALISAAREAKPAGYVLELQDALQNITNMMNMMGSPRLSEPAFESDHLRILAKTNADRIAEMQPHIELAICWPVERTATLRR